MESVRRLPALRRQPATDDPDGIWVTEVWRTQADHQGSLALPATQALIAVARPLIAGMSGRVEFEPVRGQGPESLRDNTKNAKIAKGCGPTLFAIFAFFVLSISFLLNLNL